MKVRWLDIAVGVARLERGVLLWKRTTIVERSGYECWRYSATGDKCEAWMSRHLEWTWTSTRVEVEMADKERRNWTRGRLPPARLMGRK